MFKNMKPLPKAIVLGAATIGVVFAAKSAMQLDFVAKYFAPKPSIAVQVPDKIDVPTSMQVAGAAANGTVINVASANGQQIRVKTIPWNGTLGMMHAKASGGFKARGLEVSVAREDDYAKLIADLAAFAKDPTQGSHFVVIMGDGAPGFVAGANEALKAFGQSVALIPGIGYSRGEDKCIIADGVDVRGSLIKGYFGDGDINICLKFAADNGIPVNVDPKVYDPNAVNLTNAGSFVEADQAFIASAQSNFTSGASCEDRTNITTGKSQKVCVTGTATWTPGDTNVFGQLAKLGKSIKVLASTKEYAWQMPTTLVGNKQWIEKNHGTVEAFMAAIFEGGEKVRSDNGALMVAAGEQAKVTGEQDASYWASMFKGTTETGPNGKPIELGGSTTNGLADAAFLLGLNGADNLYKKVYTVYGGINLKFFPETMPGGLPKYEDVVNTSVVKALLSKSTNTAKAVTPTFSATTQTFAAKSVSIEFETGKATFTPKATAALNAILDDAAVTSLSVQINGHTDNVGDSNANLALSKARAEAVKQFLMTNAPSNFPNERITSRGFGDTQPVGDNKTAAGKAQNRRVEILLRK